MVSQIFFRVVQNWYRVISSSRFFRVIKECRNRFFFSVGIFVLFLGTWILIDFSRRKKKRMPIIIISTMLLGPQQLFQATQIIKELRGFQFFIREGFTFFFFCQATFSTSFLAIIPFFLPQNASNEQRFFCLFYDFSYHGGGSTIVHRITSSFYWE